MTKRSDKLQEAAALAAALGADQEQISAVIAKEGAKEKSAAESGAVKLGKDSGALASAMPGVAEAANAVAGAASGASLSAEEAESAAREEALERERQRLVAEPRHRQAIIEAVLFAAAYPVHIDELVLTCGWSRQVLLRDLDELEVSLAERGVELQRIAGACRLVTASVYAPWVERYLKINSRMKLSRPQIETLAIVAYNQPVTRAIIDSYRGVHCERVLNQLDDLHLIKELGRAESPGRPILYGTTAEFLRYFSLDSLKDLPKLFAAPPPPEPAPEDDAEVDDVPIPAPAPAGNDSALDSPSAGLQKLFAKLRRKRDREEENKENMVGAPANDEIPN